MQSTDSTPPSSFDLERDDLASRFRAIALALPGGPAVEDTTTRWTYEQLAARSGAIAAMLERRLAGPRSVVAILMPTDALHIATVLGVLEADHVYLSLDPAYPETRLNEMIRIAGATHVCTTRMHAALAERLGAAVVELDAPPGTTETARPSRPPGSPLALACLYFTSGSTGAPKAVAHTHRNILFDIGRQTRDMRVTAEDRFDLLFSASFSAFLSPVFGALLTGASVHPFNLKAHTAAQLRERLERSRITISTMSVSGFRHLAGVLPPERGFPDLRALSVGAEPLALEDLATFRRHFQPGAILQNALATTETRTITQICHPGEGPMPAAMSVGRPVDGKSLRLVGPDGTPVEGEAEGEIVIESEFICPGRWEELRTLPGLRLPGPRTAVHRTGDVGRRLPGGDLLHLGRNDDQVKLRGHRVSLGDIESALLAHHSVRTAAAVLVAGDEERKTLVALVVARAGAGCDARTLEAHLRARLPDYMIPARIVFTEALPLTATGKVARRDLASLVPREERAAPAAPARTGGVEASILELWRSLLRRSDPDPDDDFFACGGDSLLATEIMAAIERLHKVRLPVGGLFEWRTPRLLARRIAETREDASPLAFVRLHPGAGGSPIYLLPPWNSSCLLFRGLAGIPGGLHPLIALEGSDARVRGAPPDSIEAIASLHADALAARHPLGDCSIGGYSMGGFVAWETCQQLLRRGIRVERMILLDCPRLFSRPSEADLAWMRRMRSLPGRMRSLAVRVVGVRNPRHRAFLASTTRSLRERLAQRLGGRERPDVPPPWAEDLAHNITLSTAYHVDPYDGEVLLVRAERQGEWVNRILPDLGWRGWCDGGLHIEHVPGDHHSMFLHPHVGALHAALQGGRAQLRAA